MMTLMIGRIYLVLGTGTPPYLMQDGSARCLHRMKIDLLKPFQEGDDIFSDQRP